MWRGTFIKFRFFSGLGELLSPLPVFPHSWRGRGSALRRAGWGGHEEPAPGCSPWPPRASAAGGRKRAELGTATLPGLKTTNSRRLPGRKPGSRRGRGACAPPGPRRAPARPPPPGAPAAASGAPGCGELAVHSAVRCVHASCSLASFFFFLHLFCNNIYLFYVFVSYDTQLNVLNITAFKYKRVVVYHKIR